MSFIIVKPKNIKISAEYIFEEIPVDKFISIGYCYSKDGKLIVKKSKDDFVNEIGSLIEPNVLIYLNYSIKEELEYKTREEANPIVKSNVALVSSGNLFGHTENLGNRNQLDVFYEKKLKEFEKCVPDFWFSKQGKWFLENIIKPYSTIAAMNQRGEISIINETSGHYNNGVWLFDSFMAINRYKKPSSIFNSEHNL